MKKFRTMSLASWVDVRNILTKLEQGRIHFLSEPQQFLGYMKNAMCRPASFHVYQTSEGDNLKGLPKLIDKAEGPWSEMYFAIFPNILAPHADNVPYCLVTGPSNTEAQARVIESIATTNHERWVPTSIVVAKGRKVLAYHQNLRYACLSHKGLAKKKDLPFSEMRTLDDKVQYVFSTAGQEEVIYEAKK